MCRFYKKLNNLFSKLSMFVMLNAILVLIIALIYLLFHIDTIDQILRPTFYIDYFLYIMIAIAYGLYTVNNDLVSQMADKDVKEIQK